MSYKCVGCDGLIPWDGESAFAYTCPCGASMFYDTESLTLAMPASLVWAISRCKAGVRPEVPHIGYYIGSSSDPCKIKEIALEQLLALGLIWRKDCEQCREDGTYDRQLERESEQALSEAEYIISSHQHEEDNK